MSYTMELTRSGKWWHVHVPELGESTQGRTLAEADEMARDLIVLAEEDRGVHLEPDAIKLHRRVQLPDSVVSQLREADELRAQAKQSQQAAVDAQSAAVRELRESGVSMRDAASALGLSHQRVSQLANH